MQTILQPMEESEVLQNARKALKEPGALQMTGCLEAQKNHIIQLFAQGRKRCLIISFREQKARELMEDASYYGRESVYYPAKDFLFAASYTRSGELQQERSLAYQRLIEAPELDVYTTMDAFLEGLRPKEEVRGEVLTLETGMTKDPQELAEKLSAMGYERNFQAESPGEFAVRGGIVDVFTLSEDIAYRIEFFDDEIDSIRSYDPGTQRSIENLGQVRIYPLEKQDSQEGSGSGEEKRDSFFSYFDPQETIVFLDDSDRCFGRIREIQEEVEDSRQHRKKDKDEPLPEPVFFGEESVKKELSAFPVLALSALDQPAADLDVKETFSLPAKSTPHYHGSIDELKKDLERLLSQKYRVLLVSASRTRAKRLGQDLLEEGISCFYTEDAQHPISPGEAMLTPGRLPAGFEYPQLKFAVMADGDIFPGKQPKKRRKKQENGERIASFSDLHPGDYVIHENYGVGIYRGMEQIEAGGVVKDYFKIEYAKKGALYVQANQLDLIQKYTGGEGKKPRLSTLGSKEWQKTKNRVSASVDDIAQELVDLYALRSEKKGFVFSPDTVWQREFEEMFPYEETKDQEDAIEAVKKDMESTKIMDRLICGDVGFGKTEVAIRAAFKAVQDSKQVAFLVPTTILAEQHYNTFTERMKNFPVKVEMLSRFRTPAEQKKAIEGVKKGSVDILIGTHRLLSSDVKFKDLGLLIIDEEQRFGVAHKEKIKQMKTQVDVLSLSATPIPRTLHMSMIGIRDMSLLEEAPSDRQPIQTYVMEYDDEIVREAILRELKRGGQVYFVYNRVKDIADVARRVANLVPQARVGYAHGQMRENQLEDVMMSFVRDEIDVLVSTTIVETGLDISNVNTIIIADADRMGVSQLYQLRGRVGRSSRTASAFLMYRKDKVLPEVAEKRLAAIREFTDLGSGIRIAMRDLEIRGAGSLLGAKQSGNMETVGYELYCKMLHTAIRRLRGEKVQDSFETSLDLNVDAYIPDTYISNEFSKMDVYKRIAQIETEQERMEMEDELVDRFGDLPRPVSLLLLSAEIKALAHRCYIEQVKETGSKVQLLLYKKAELDAAAIPAFLQRYPMRLLFHAAPEPEFVFSQDPKKKKMDQLFELKGLLTDMEKSLCGTAK